MTSSADLSTGGMVRGVPVAEAVADLRLAWVSRYIDDREIALQKQSRVFFQIAGAGHASASGRLEDQHLFYLMARGIPLDEARRLVIQGFFGELLEKIEIGDVRDRVAKVVEAELA